PGPHRHRQAVRQGPRHPRPRRPRRRPARPGRRRRPGARRDALLLRRRSLRPAVPGPWLHPQLRRQRDLQERRRPARRRGGHATREPPRGDRRAVPDPDAVPRPPQRAVPDPADRPRPRRDQVRRCQHPRGGHLGNRRTHLRPLVGGAAQVWGSTNVPWWFVSDLLGPADVRGLASRLGVSPTKTLGQNFVVDANTVRRIARAADLDPGDVVVEVGPGLGSLTLALLPACAHLYAVEIDPVLAAELPATVAARAPGLADRLTVIGADAMKVDAADFPGP